VTHSLHRKGSYESLVKDYVILTAPSTGINQNGAKEKLVRHFRIALRHKPINLGANSIGHMHCMPVEQVIEKVEGKTHTHNVVFNEKEAVIEFLKELKGEELGLSVVVSGIYDEVVDCLKKAGLEPHTVNFSLGVHGNMNKLPDDERISEITTMCGHGLISYNLVKSLVDDIKHGKSTPEDAAQKLAEPCYCALFNVIRAAGILSDLAE